MRVLIPGETGLIGRALSADLVSGNYDKEEMMAKTLEGTAAPDFTLTDTQGTEVTLSSYQGDRHVVLVFNRGLM